MSASYDVDDNRPIGAEDLADDLFRQFGQQAVVAARTGVKFAEYANDAEEQALYEAALKILTARLSGSR